MYWKRSYPNCNGNRREKRGTEDSGIKNFKFKIIKIRTDCQYVGYFCYSENLNWAAQNLRLGRGLDIAALEDTQRGFRPGRSTTDQIFILQQFFDKSWKHAKDVYMKMNERHGNQIYWTFLTNCSSQLYVNLVASADTCRCYVNHSVHCPPCQS